MTVIARTRAELDAALVGTPHPRSVVMTMGALHEGHATLIREARSSVDGIGTVVVTVFVNPLQFGADEDLDQYPRTFDEDFALCEREGVDVLFAPGAREVYPHGEPQVRLDPGPLGDELEGAARPGHFSGVLTVVTVLLNLVRPDIAMFGEKDFQQLVLVRRLVADLRMRVEVRGVNIVREADGLALSSRNRYLDEKQRARAAAIPIALRAGAAASDGGPEVVVKTATESLNSTSGIEIDYLVVRDLDLGPAPHAGPARLLVAARVGATRLLDNVPIELGV